MRILLYDNDPDELESLYKMLISISADFIIDKVTQVYHGGKLYEQHQYAFVFINSDCNEGEIFLNNIAQENPSQKLIAFSNSLDCAQDLRCNFCKEGSNRFLLIKPIYTNDLFYILLGNLKPPSYCENNNLLMKLKKIDQSYINFDLSLENQMFINKNSFLNREDKILHVTEELKQHNIRYEIDATQNIKIILQE